MLWVFNDINSNRKNYAEMLVWLLFCELMIMHSYLRVMWNWDLNFNPLPSVFENTMRITNFTSLHLQIRTHLRVLNINVLFFSSKIAISRRLPPTKPLSGKLIWDLVEFILLVLSSLEWIPFITGHSFNPSFPTKGQQASAWNSRSRRSSICETLTTKTPSKLRGQGTGSLNSGDSWICNQRSGIHIESSHNV